MTGIMIFSVSCSDSEKLGTPLLVFRYDNSEVNVMLVNGLTLTGKDFVVTVQRESTIDNPDTQIIIGEAGDQVFTEQLSGVYNFNVLIRGEHREVKNILYSGERDLEIEQGNNWSLAIIRKPEKEPAQRTEPENGSVRSGIEKVEN